MPDKFEVLSGGDVCNYSSQFRGIYAGIHDDIKLFSEMTEDEGLARVCNDPESIYHKYESERISHLTRRLESSLDCCETIRVAYHGKRYYSNAKKSHS